MSTPAPPVDCRLLKDYTEFRLHRNMASPSPIAGSGPYIFDARPAFHHCCACRPPEVRRADHSGLDFPQAASIFAPAISGLSLERQPQVLADTLITARTCNCRSRLWSSPGTNTAKLCKCSTVLLTRLALIKSMRSFASQSSFSSPLAASNHKT